MTTMPHSPPGASLPVPRLSPRPLKVDESPRLPRFNEGSILAGEISGNPVYVTADGPLCLRGLSARVLDACARQDSLEEARGELERLLGTSSGSADVADPPDPGELLRLILDVLARHDLVEPLDVPVDGEARREFLRHPERLAPHLPFVERPPG